LYSNALDIFGVTFSYDPNRQRSQNNNKWFDENCYKLKKEFKKARNIFNRNKNDINRQIFINSRNAYNKAKKTALRKNKLSEGKRVNELAHTNPREFWKNVKRKTKSQNKQSDNLKVEDLFEHFKIYLAEIMTMTTRIIHTRTPHRVIPIMNWIALFQLPNCEKQCLLRKIISARVLTILPVKLSKAALTLFHHFC
jgi:hypothetical protein